ncbi:ABC transporter substrate-binding protein [Rhizobium sp. TRM95796]|uniref:ABC transporter substrate-binding protein n=1 Tax=Rhizobium sp. TRM95796 TaxID=2979862 RepID=UPI0021E90A69|nr:ABC transporter substrate-binding protein [Rhizobium sp. TRM95796]MCV3764235.1 ABC transporter substrate-binding protein [Rhizobium sp. TRM95796]
MSIKPFLLAALVAAFASSALSAPIKIAVVAPEGDALGLLGDQARRGANAAAGDRAELVMLSESCEDGSGPKLADMIKAAGVQAAVGFLCTDSLDGSLAPLSEAKIPVITIGIRAPIPMEDALRHGWPLFRLAPGPQAERERITETIRRYWADKPFALLDDGTITSRDTAEWVRNALETQGLKPTFTDTFRPAQEVQTQLMRRLAKASVTHVFAAADRADMAVIARDAKKAGLPLVFLGGDALNAVDMDAPLESGVLAVTTPDWTEQPDAKAIVEALAATGQSADGYALPAAAAVTIAIDAAEISANSGADLAEALVDTPFDTAIGLVSFTKSHELETNPFTLMRWTGERFEPAVTVE